MKALVSGAAVALASGLLMGAALKPDLAYDGRPAGPQILAGFGGERSTGPFDDGPTLASYSGKLPDYVLGTDFKRATTVFPTAEAPPPVKEVKDTVADDDTPDISLTRASYDDEASEDAPPQPSYPSIDGGAPAAHAQAADIEPDDPAVG